MRSNRFDAEQQVCWPSFGPPTEGRRERFVSDVRLTALYIAKQCLGEDLSGKGCQAMYQGCKGC